MEVTGHFITGIEQTRTGHSSLVNEGKRAV
jgi:hypothetical protein